jgi:hypothetical protein
MTAQEFNSMVVSTFCALPRHTQHQWLDFMYGEQNKVNNVLGYTSDGKNPLTTVMQIQDKLVPVKVQATFQVTGRGTVFYISCMDNGLKFEDLHVGMDIATGGKEYTVTGIEGMRGLSQVRDHVGLLVKEK